MQVVRPLQTLLDDDLLVLWNKLVGFFVGWVPARRNGQVNVLPGRVKHREPPRDEEVPNGTGESCHLFWRTAKAVVKASRRIRPGLAACERCAARTAEP